LYRRAGHGAGFAGGAKCRQECRLLGPCKVGFVTSGTGPQKQAAGGRCRVRGEHSGCSRAMEVAREKVPPVGG
jgi:hypothetical protein